VLAQSLFPDAMSNITLKNIAEEKCHLRDRLLIRRNQLFAADASEALARNFFSKVEMREGAAVAGYWPIRGEIDSRPLMGLLHCRGYRCGLCVVKNRGEPLVFRSWHPSMKLVSGPFGTSVPPLGATNLVPEFILVPLLAFDDAGYRLGYGGGFYDMSLSSLRAKTKPPIAVGLAYEGQAISSVPHDSLDERLDWVITEAGARRIDREQL